MAGPDLSLITNTPNLTDRIMQQQQFSQLMQGQQIDVRTKQNLYSSQVMSAAAASGDPQRIQMAKQALAQANIDPSSWSDDPAQVKLQATALQQSLMSPLGVLNAGINKEKADAETAATNGNKAPGFTGIGSIGQGSPSLNTPMPSSGGQGAPLPASAPAADVPVFKQAVPPQPPSLTAPIQASATPAMPAAPASTDEKYAGMNPKTLQEALKTDTEIYNKRPDVQAAVESAKTQAGVTGTEVGDAKKTYDIATAGLPFALQRFTAMRDAAKSASSGMGVDQAGDGTAQQFANTSLGKFIEPNTGTGNQTLKQYASQGVLGELGPQLAQAGVRGNKFLESIASNASGLDMSAAPDDKVTLINGLQDMYVQNLKKEAAVLRSNGQPAMTDAQIDALVNAKTQGKQSTANTKTINGVTYTKDANGVWHAP